jgi:hypothetical protein
MEQISCKSDSHLAIHFTTFMLHKFYSHFQTLSPLLNYMYLIGTQRTHLDQIHFSVIITYMVGSLT